MTNESVRFFPRKKKISNLLYYKIEVEMILRESTTSRFNILNVLYLI